jgi:hypothetical protein
MVGRRDEQPLRTYHDLLHSLAVSGRGGGRSSSGIFVVGRSNEVVSHLRVELSLRLLGGAGVPTAGLLDGSLARSSLGCGSLLLVGGS